MWPSIATAALLPGEQLVEVRTVLRQVQVLGRFLASRVATAPALADLPRRLPALPELEAALSRMLDEAGVLRDDASPRLAERNELGRHRGHWRRLDLAGSEFG